MSDSSAAAEGATTLLPPPPPVGGGILNINVGVLGHVDSGKTTLVKALSTSLSTAALDKNPQSQQRGITLDLGFSAFSLPMPGHLATACPEYSSLQFTLVDCPGHASLIRTIIGGAQIIDMILLVIDANKGIQTQTAECIVIGEITTNNMLIVLNKIDMIPEDEREAKIEKVSNRIRKVFAQTKFANVMIVPTAAMIGGEKVASVGAATAAAAAINNKTTSSSSSSAVTSSVAPASYGVDNLVKIIQENVKFPTRNVNAPFYYAIDHCFPIKGHGTVLTGTVLSGQVLSNNMIEIPHLQVQRKVKSMQMFKKPVKYAKQGDRVAICVSNLDAKLVERSIACTPGTVPLLSTVICLVKKVRFFKGQCKSNSKFHVSIGHTTVLANATFFGTATEMRAVFQQQQSAAADDSGSSDCSTKANDFLSDNTAKASTATVSAAGAAPGKKNTVGTGKVQQQQQQQVSLNTATFQSGFPQVSYPWDVDFEYQHELVADDGSTDTQQCQWVLLQFPQPVYCPLGSLIIASRLDTDVTAHAPGSNAAAVAAAAAAASTAGSSGECRLAFYGPVKEMVTGDTPEAALEKVRIFNWKERPCEIFKLTDVRQQQKAGSTNSKSVVKVCYEAVGCKLVSETGGGASVLRYLGMSLRTSKGDIGKIIGAFGSDGKFKVKFERGATQLSAGTALTLRYKRFVHDKTKAMQQHGVDELPPAPATALYVPLPAPTPAPAPVVAPTSKLTAGAATTDTAAPAAANVEKLSPQVKLVEKKSKTATESRSPPIAAVQEEVEKAMASTFISSPSADKAMNSNSTSSSSSTSAVSPSSLLDKGPTSVPSVPMTTTAPAAKAVAATAIQLSATQTGRRVRTGVLDSLKGDAVPVHPVSGVTQEGCFDMAIVSGAFSIEEDIKALASTAEVLFTDEQQQVHSGTLIGPFGKLGKIKVKFPCGCNGPLGGKVTVITDK